MYECKMSGRPNKFPAPHWCHLVECHCQEGHAINKRKTEVIEDHWRSTLKVDMAIVTKDIKEEKSPWRQWQQRRYHSSQPTAWSPRRPPPRWGSRSSSPAWLCSCSPRPGRSRWQCLQKRGRCTEPGEKLKGGRIWKKLQTLTPVSLKVSLLPRLRVILTTACFEAK